MKKISIITAIFFTSSIAYAQKTISQKEDFNKISVVSPAGSSFQNEEISISWTLGNTLYTLSEDSTTEIPAELVDLNVSIKSYPNPTRSNLIISSDIAIKKPLKIVVFDVNGKLLFQTEMSQKINILSLKHLPSALYLIKVLNSQNLLVKTFKIVKN